MDPVYCFFNPLEQMINKAFINGLCEALTTESNKGEEVLDFVFLQLKIMPDYLRTGIVIATIFAQLIAVLRFFKPFQKINLEKRKRILKKIQSNNIFLLGDLLKFYSSLILLRSLETYPDNEKN